MSFQSSFVKKLFAFILVEFDKQVSRFCVYHDFLGYIDREMVDDKERKKEGRSRERIWRGKFHFPRDLFAYFRATLFFTSVARREPWIQGYLACSSQNHQLRSFRSAVYPSLLKGEVVFIFSYISTFLFQSVWTFWEAAFLRALQIHPDKVCSSKHPSFSTRTGVFSFLRLVHSNLRLGFRRVWIVKGEPYEEFHRSMCVISEKAIPPKWKIRSHF